MPHVAWVPFSGVRVRDQEMLELGMSLPGLQPRAQAVAQLPALGALTLAGLTPETWTSSYHPADGDLEEVIEGVMAQEPDLVALSALTASIEEAYRFAGRMRQYNVPTVLGGLHTTSCPDEAGRHVDAVVVGAGEPCWRELLGDVERGELRRLYRSSPRAPLDWALPRYDLLGSTPQRFTLQTERGCPLACEFCGASRLLGRFLEKPVDQVRRELDAILAIEPRPLVELADDNTFAARPDADALLEVLEQSSARWFTETDWRLGERPEILGRLARAGCVQVLVGIESLVFRYPGMGAKQAELQRIMEAVVAIQEAGVAVNGCFIVGADGETRGSLERLQAFLLDSPLADLQLTLQTPFPGTRLYERLKRQGRLLADRSWSCYTLFDVAFQPDLLTVGELEQGFRELLRAVFSPQASARREAIRRRIWRVNPRLAP